MTSSCGFHLQNENYVLKTLGIYNDDNSPLIQTVKKYLYLNKIEFFDSTLLQANVQEPSLLLEEKIKYQEVIGMFQDVNIKENLITLKLSATLFMPNKKAYSIDTTFSKSFFSNTEYLLETEILKKNISQEIREQAVKNLMYKLLKIYNQKNKK